jgi:hypothetical protein
VKTKGAIVVAAGILLGLGTVGAQAAPQFAPADSAIVTSNIQLAAQGCGRGFHRGPYGGCRRNMSPRWPCWWRRGPYGRWFMVCH